MAYDERHRGRARGKARLVPVVGDNSDSVPMEPHQASLHEFSHLLQSPRAAPHLLVDFIESRCERCKRSNQFFAKWFYLRRFLLLFRLLPRALLRFRLWLPP